MLQPPPLNHSFIRETDFNPTPGKKDEEEKNNVFKRTKENETERKKNSVLTRNQLGQLMTDDIRDPSSLVINNTSTAWWPMFAQHLTPIVDPVQPQTYTLNFVFLLALFGPTSDLR
ncbi:hypothetical protein TNCT_172271 [Trichonephila clavata]|uniref:Uncharacterized protein n=1 Tax=Trichonephila clavata TaxID=2740835 RepID=A0A8X6H0P1_TRICU|nr:hypothetical protein TNCT_172271 [Trichonephila clavata]